MKKDGPCHGPVGPSSRFTRIKAPLNECDEYRGVVLEPHLAKALKVLIADEVNAAHGAFIPDAQHGAVAGKGTDLCGHLLTLML